VAQAPSWAGTIERPVPQVLIRELLLFLFSKQSNDVVHWILLRLLLLLLSVPLRGIPLLSLVRLRLLLLLLLTAQRTEKSLNPAALLLCTFAPNQTGNAASERARTPCCWQKIVLLRFPVTITGITNSPFLLASAVFR